MNIPARITNGDSVSWLDDPTVDNLKNKLSPPSWTLSYSIVGAIKIELTAAQFGSGWKTSMTTTQSLTLTPGDYYWQAYATNGSDRVNVGSGKLVIMPNLHTATAGDDLRSQTKKDLDAVQSAMRAIISGGAVSRYTIGHRQVEKMAMSDLLVLESRLKILLKREEGSGNGQGSPNNTFVRF